MRCENKNLGEENILDGTSKYFTLAGNKKDQNHCDVTFIWGEITLMSGQTLMKRTKYFFLFCSDAVWGKLFMVEQMGLLWKFFSLKHIKNLYLSSFLTQKSNFQSLPLPKSFYLIFIKSPLLSIGEGQSWFGKWVELPWYWCVRVELSLQQGEAQGAQWQ